MEELYEDDYIYDKKLLLGSTKVSQTFLKPIFLLEQQEVPAVVSARPFSDRFFKSSLRNRSNVNQINTSTEESSSAEKHYIFEKDDESRPLRPSL
jgi:hypothetical protein